MCFRWEHRNRPASHGTFLFLRYIQRSIEAVRVSGFKGLFYKPLEKQVVLTNLELNRSPSRRICARSCESKVRIAVISPFVDRQHGTERAVAELIDRLSNLHHDQIDLYAQQVSDLSTEGPSQTAENDRRAIYWHRVETFPGPHLSQFLG